MVLKAAMIPPQSHKGTNKDTLYALNEMKFSQNPVVA
jgi:hypothetical protein